MAKIFLSFTEADRPWAEWIGVTLRDNGHLPFLHIWEIGAGQNIPRWMEQRINEADHLLGVFSEDYVKGIYSNSERWAAYWQDPGGSDGFLIPVEVKTVTTWPPLVRPLRRLSLVGLDEAEAEEKLLRFLEPPKPPERRPAFPGGPGLRPADGDQNTSAAGSGTAFMAQSEPLPQFRPSLPSAEGTGGAAATDEKVPDPRDRKAFETWLSSKPREWSVVIAARAALRVLPMGYEPRVSNYETHIILPLFCAIAISRFAAVCPNREIAVTAATDALAAATDALATATVTTATDALATAIAAAHTAIAAAHNAVTAAAATVTAATDALATATVTTATAAADATALTSLNNSQQVSGVPISSRSLTRSQLWAPDRGMPPFIAKAWSELKEDLLRHGDHWRVWINWYEDILAGSPPAPERSEAWEAAFTDVDEPLPWQEGPEAVNRAIQARLDALGDPAVPPLPEQADGPHYRVDEEGRIDRAPPADMDAEGNDLRTIGQLRPLILRCAAELRSRLSINQFPELIAAIERYEAALQPAHGAAVAWGEVWGLGVILQSAAAAAERQISDRMLPEMEDPAKSALASLVRMHGPLILATTMGARLTEQSATFDMPPQRQSELRRIAQEIVEDLQATPDIITPGALDTAGPAVHHMGEGPRPERSSLYGLVNIKNIGVVLLGGAAVGSPALLGMLLGGPGGALAGAPFSFLAAETIKKNPTFLALVQQLNVPLEKALDEKAWERQIRKFSPFRAFVIRNQEPLRHIARSTAELAWMVRYIDFITAEQDGSGPA